MVEAKYPNETVKWKDKINGEDIVDANDINQAYAEIIAIEDDLRENLLSGMEVTSDSPIISMPDNALNGQISGSIKGDTIVNYTGTEGKGYNSSEDDILVNNGNIHNGILEMVADGENFRNFRMKMNFKPNTQYTAIVDVLEMTLKYDFILIRHNEIDTSNVFIPIGFTGKFVRRFTTGDTVGTSFLSYINNANPEGGRVKLKNFMILEGDYTNRLVNYIEGTKSVPASFKIKSVGRNLFDGSGVRAYLQDGDVHWNDGILSYRRTQKNVYSGALVKVRLKKGETYHLKYKEMSTSTPYFKRLLDSKLNLVTWLHGNDKNFIATDEIMYILFTNGAYQEDMVIISDIVIEKGTVATEYEDYKEDTSYVVAKDKDNKIVNLNRLPNGVYDAIDLGRGELIKNTKDYTLQSSDIRYVSTEKENIDYAQIHLRGYARGNLIADGVIIHNIPRGGITVHNMDDEKYIGTWGGLSSRNGDIVYVVKKGTTLEQAKEQLVGTKLIYQLAEPEHIPIEIEGELQGYENGTVYFTPYIKDRFIVDDTKTITLQYPIKSIDKILKLDTANATWTEVEGTLSEDGQTMTVSEKGTYKVYGEIQEGYSTNGLKTIITPINLNGQINSNTTAIEKINNKIYTDADLFTAMLLQQEVRITALEGGMTV